MSVLVACRGLAHETASEVDHHPITTLTRSVSYLEALAYWQVQDPSKWEAITSLHGRPWGDLVNEAISDPLACKTLAEALGTLGRSCDELAIWYAGFPDEIPNVATPGEFERVLEEQLVAGNLEPAVRMIRLSPRRQKFDERSRTANS